MFECCFPKAACLRATRHYFKAMYRKKACVSACRLEFTFGEVRAGTQAGAWSQYYRGMWFASSVTDSG